ncbi:hypothetical protein SEVIR_7G138050v4 [Setaria viridis]
MQRPACPTTPSHFAPHQTSGVSREKKVSLSVHTHIQLDSTAEKETRHRILKLKLQVSVRVEAETGKGTKNGYPTKQRRTMTLVGSEPEHALLVSSFLLTEGTRKQGGG